MTDPLLTIEDATREFRVSPKTIRRRLTSGEIAGAYKRPGNRGPEWVMPRQSLADAGFAPRPLAATTAVPTDADERASYWEQRALDAEAALQAGGHARRRRVGARRWAFIGVSLVVALVAAFVVLQSRSDPVPGREAGGAGAMGTVVALLEQETDPGDAIGLVGERRTDAIPAGRMVAPSPRAGWESPAGPRFVVATFDDSAPPPAVASLRTSADRILRTPHGDLTVEVFDRTPRAGVAAQDLGADASGPAPGSDVGVAVPAPEADPDAASAPLADPAPASAPDPVTQPGVVEVLEGDSFWTIADAVVSAELGVDAPTEAVTAYWAALVSANADRLVEPGNADLLHVGQAIVLPPRT
jgi:hypothetical protein